MLIAAVSGGLDSVAMLWRLLTETDQPVHVHHVHMRQRVDFGRARAELKALDAILRWIDGRARPFVYTTSMRGPASMRSSDIVVVTEECAKAGLVYPRGAVTGLARGANWHDMNSGATNRRQAAAQAAWERFWGSGAPPIVFPIGELTRPEVWAILPEELARLTWSCRRPMAAGENRLRHCGACRTCRELIAHGVPTERTF